LQARNSGESLLVAGFLVLVPDAPPLPSSPGASSCFAARLFFKAIFLVARSSGGFSSSPAGLQQYSCRTLF